MISPTSSIPDTTFQLLSSSCPLAASAQISRLIQVLVGPSVLLSSNACFAPRHGLVMVGRALKQSARAVGAIIRLAIRLCRQRCSRLTQSVCLRLHLIQRSIQRLIQRLIQLLIQHLIQHLIQLFYPTFDSALDSGLVSESMMGDLVDLEDWS